METWIVTSFAVKREGISRVMLVGNYLKKV